MKKILAARLMGFFLLGLLTFTGFGQDARNILNKMIDAAGGRKALEGIKDTTYHGTMEILMYGVSGTITFYHKEPNNLRQDMDFGGMVFSSASDGEVSWMMYPQTGMVDELTGEALEDARNQAINFGYAWLLYPEKYGFTYADKGKETIDGKEYIVLQQTSKDGQITTFHIDPETYLVFKSKTMTFDVQMGFQVEIVTVMEDYRSVGGIMVSHSAAVYQDGEMLGTMIVDEVKFNSGLEDSLFKK